MSKIGLVIGREYSSRVRKKSFIIMTILGPLLFAGIIAAAIWVSVADNTEHEVLVVDYAGMLSYVHPETGRIEPSYPEIFQGDENLFFHFTDKLPSDSAFINSPYTLMLEFDDSILAAKKAHLYYKDLPSAQVSMRITGALENGIERVKVRENDQIDYSTYKRLKTSLTLAKFDINNKEDASMDQEKGIVGMMLAIIIFFFIFLYGSQVMRGVIEEKSNRIVEVIVSSIKPFQLMMGKIIGIGLVGLTQFLIWILFSILIFTAAGMIFESGGFDSVAAVDGLRSSGQTPIDFETFLQQQDGFSLLVSINWPLILFMFFIYFVGGYLLYGSLFASVGAAVDSETDTQQFLMPVMLPLFFSYFVAIMSVSNPEGFAAKLFSFIPLSSPIIMMIRTPLNSTTVWELLISVAILFATAVFFVWLAGRIYRTGILMYGKKPSYREIWKWIKFNS
ncbi:MAG: ABC transporter permease [Flavobacteriales bacterium]|nr:ABC transporter permease [Flavobacteriales bacterium]MDP4952592.1 ABC transporter permease [Flavobacteriales bacterium]